MREVLPGPGLGRREFLSALAGASVCGGAGPAIGLSFGTYAHQMLNWEDSLELIARTGYDGVEIALIPGWPTEPARLSMRDRSRMRAMLVEHDLAVPAFLENLRIADPSHAPGENRDRLLRAIELGRQIVPGTPPIFETVLGRKPDEWDEVRHQMVEEAGELANVAAQGRTVICFKPHVANAVNDVDRSLWLLEQVASPWFRCTYDFSHLWLAGLELVSTMEQLIPVSPYVHLKDAVKEGDSHRFLLPGDGETDYSELCSQLLRLGFAGYANVEVSAQIHRELDYQPILTTRVCYERMAAAFESAGISRP